MGRDGHQVTARGAEEGMKKRNGSFMANRRHSILLLHTGRSSRTVSNDIFDA